MDVESPTPRKLRFGVFQLDTASGELYKHGVRIRLQEQPFQVLSVLLERPGEMVSREDLRKRLWGHDTYVDFDHSLNISINKLRDALGDSAATPRFIETLPRRGYRFIAPVTAEESSPQAQTGSAPSPTIPFPAAESAPPQRKGFSLKDYFGRVGVVALCLFAILALWLWKRNTSQPAREGRAMLAVLPFQNLTPEGGQDYFITGLHDELIAQLGRLDPSRLGVIARTSTAPYANARKPVDQIGRDLHVDYVLDGTVRKSANHFRITAELIQVSDQTHLWTQTYEPSLNDLLALQEDVARRVSAALSIRFLPEAQQEMQQYATANADAYEAYLRGRLLWHEETRESLELAVTQFEKTIGLDPAYAPAYVGLADTYNVMGGYGFVPADEAFSKGKAAAAKALELAPNFSDAYTSMGFASFYYDWNWSESERLFKRALVLNPNNQLAHEFYSSFLHAMGRLDEAEAENRIAKELDPLDAWLYDDKGWMLLSRRQPEQAIPEFQKAIELNPKFPAAHLSLAVAFLRTRQYDRALLEVQQAAQSGGDPTRVLEILGSVQALSGDTAGAQATLDKLVNHQINGRVSPYSVALVYTQLGRKAEALDWLEKAYREKDTWVLWTGVLVEWDSLRSEPRFIELLRQLKMPF